MQPSESHWPEGQGRAMENNSPSGWMPPSMFSRRVAQSLLARHTLPVAVCGSRSCAVLKIRDRTRWIPAQEAASDRVSAVASNRLKGI